MPDSALARQTAAAPSRPTGLLGPMRRAARAAGLAVALALGAGAAAASPLGPLTAQSLRGEPLRAVLELPPADGPTVRLAGPATYARFGLVRDPSLAGASLRPVVERDGKRFLRIETAAPVDASELVLLLEAGGGARRAYRLRLDSPEPADRVNVRGVEPIARLDGAPPVAGAGTPDAVASSSAGPARSPATGASVRPTGPDEGRGRAAGPGAGDASAARETSAEDRADPAGAPGATAGSSGPSAPPPVPIAPPARPDALVAAAGDTLEALARTLRPPGATPEQSAFALWRANPRGFVGRPLRPLAGTRVTVPSEADVLAVPPSQAREWAASMASEAEPTGARDGATAAASAAPASAAPATAAGTAPAPRPRTAAIAAPPPARAAARPGAPATSFDAELDATLRRARELEQRVAALKAGFEAAARREEAAMRSLIESARGAPKATASTTGAAR